MNSLVIRMHQDPFDESRDKKSEGKPLNPLIVDRGRSTLTSLNV